MNPLERSARRKPFLFKGSVLLCCVICCALKDFISRKRAGDVVMEILSMYPET